MFIVYLLVIAIGLSQCYVKEGSSVLSGFHISEKKKPFKWPLHTPKDELIFRLLGS